MKLKTTVYQPKTGRHKGKWTLEIRGYDDETGSLMCSVSRQYATKQEAKDRRPAEEKRLSDTDGKVTTGDRMTFSDLCRVAEKRLLGPAVIRAGKTRKGVRSSSKYLVGTLESYFGPIKIAKITAEKIIDYGLHRYDNGGVSYSSINREVGVLRQMLKYAFGKGWITTDVFHKAALTRQRLIDKSDDVVRVRLLNDAEEDVLLACTHGKRQVSYKWKRQGVERVVETTVERFNEELLPIILVALDSGMRRGEILQMDWSHIDLDSRIITVPTENTKTMTMRRVPITKRVADALQKLPTYGESGRVFRTRYVQRSWTTAVRIAGLDDLQLRDLRRTFAKRLQGMGIEFTVIQQLLGHSPKSITAANYLPATADQVRDVADKLDARNGGLLERESAVHAELSFQSAAEMVN